MQRTTQLGFSKINRFQLIWTSNLWHSLQWILLQWNKVKMNAISRLSKNAINCLIFGTQSQTHKYVGGIATDKLVKSYEWNRECRSRVVDSPCPAPPLPLSLRFVSRISFILFLTVLFCLDFYNVTKRLFMCGRWLVLMSCLGCLHFVLWFFDLLLWSGLCCFVNNTSWGGKFLFLRF